MDVKRGIIFVMVAILCTNLISALNDTTIYQSQYLVVDTDFFTQLQIEPSGPQPTVEDVTASITFFPITTEQQRILTSDHSPTPTTIDEEEPVMTFFWQKPAASIPIHIRNRVRIESTPKKIREKILFPLNSVPDDIQKYTQPADIIDTNSDIVRLASTLAEGEDDTLIVVDKMASWVTQNIRYNLSSTAADATEKASTVLRTREGVCDELTALFISLLRAVGIPARFVAGIAYSNSPDLPQPWGPHGWAEVYFQGRGWVPYDVTYGQYGFVDASHIVTRHSADSEKIKSKFVWKGKDATIKVSDFTTGVAVVEYGPPAEPHISLDAEMMKGSVGFGSHNGVMVHVRNLLNYYQPVDVHISKTTRLSVVDDDAPTENAKYKKHILLAPHEEKTLFWTVKVDKDLDPRLIYTFPVSVSTPTGLEATTEFKAVKDGSMLSKERIEQTQTHLAPAENKTLTTMMQLACSPDKQRYQQDESVSIACTLHNQGNQFLDAVDVCAEGKHCQTIPAGINQQQELVFTLDEKDVGENNVRMTAVYDESLVYQTVSFTVLDKPLLTITNVTAPATVRYDDAFRMTIPLHKGSQTAPEQVQITIDGELVSETFDLDTLDTSLDLDLEMQGSDLKAGMNSFTIIATFTDAEGMNYQTTKTTTLSLVDVTAWQRVKIFLKSIFT